MSRRMNRVNGWGRPQILITPFSSPVPRTTSGCYLHGNSPGIATALLSPPPSATELEGVAGQLRQDFNVSVLPIAKDLRDDRSTEELFQETTVAGLVGSILAGNAGGLRRNRCDN